MYAGDRASPQPEQMSRADALSYALGRLSWPNLDLRWATLVDYDGFFLASYPPEGQFDPTTSPRRRRTFWWPVIEPARKSSWGSGASR